MVTSLMTDRTAKADRTGLVDGCGRRIDHLRVSITSACDLKCVYCRPDSLSHVVGRHDLTNEQRVQLIRFLSDHYGLGQVRITGGEPLVHRDVVSLIGQIRQAVPGLPIAMTTNARRLYHKGFELRQAGLDRLNVSLDSLDPERYRRMTGSAIDDVLRGLDSAMFVGFPPPKINAVVLNGINDEEIIPLTRWAIARGSELRFLEAMPIGPAADLNRRAFVSAATIRARLEEQFSLEPLVGEPGDTAKRYAVTDGTTTGVVGVIAPVSEPFCGGCRRMRITAEGRLFPCLLDDRSVNLSVAWKGGKLDGALVAEMIESAVAGKRPQGQGQSTPMVALGG